MKLKMGKTLACVCALMATEASIAPVEAQTERALQRRVERNERQLQRQANRADYYPTAAWQQLDPWIRQSGVVPFSGTTGNSPATAAAAVNPAPAAANAVAGAANAVKQTVDAATRIGDGQFGFRDKSPQTGWFYDYYTISPTYYTPQGEDRYSSAIRYFDSDNDGVYDSQSYYRDSDNDGRYDEYDQLDFYASPAQQSKVAVETREKAPQTSLYEGPDDSRRHRLAGEIAMTKVAKVDSNEHLVVALKDANNEGAVAIDMGPAKRLQGKQVEVGAQIVAFGSLQQMGDKQLLVADTVQLANGESIRIDRSFGSSFTGEIVDLKTIQVNNADYYMAVVNIDGERQLVDLGPTTTYKVALKPGAKLMIQGVPVRTSDHRVILAQQVDMGNNNVLRIERTRQF